MTDFLKGDISEPIVRVDAYEKADGSFKYVGDRKIPGMLNARMVRSSISRGKILKVNLPKLPKGYYWIDHNDIPSNGKNNLQMMASDYRCFASGNVLFVGETIGLLVGESVEVLNDLYKEVKIDYEVQEAANTIQEGLDCKGGAFVNSDNIHCSLKLEKGENLEKVFATCDHIYTDEIETGYQEHTPMETNGMFCVPSNGKFIFYASSQCPFYIRKSICGLIGAPLDKIDVRQVSTGGAFGKKEHFPDVLAGPLLVAVNKIKKPISLIYSREEDIAYSVKRHPSLVRFKTGVKNGKIVAVDSKVYYNVGAYLMSSFVVLQRGCFHIQGCYNFENQRTEGKGVATNNFPSCAFRGFGAPQTLFAIETHLNHIAKELGYNDPMELKSQYLIKKGDDTITNGKIVEEVMLPKMIKDVKKAADYDRKVKEYKQGSGKGIGFALYNHGGAFTGNGEQMIIKAKVNVKKLKDGKVLIETGQTEMGQGIKTALRKIAAKELNMPIEKVLYNDPDTDLVPDSGPTAASRSTMVPGYLVQLAAKELKERWAEADELTIQKEYKHPDGFPWDQSTFQGYAYLGYGWGVCCVEVEVDKRTAEAKIVGVWSSHDIGHAIDSQIVHGQVNGGIAQGLGWASSEVLNVVNGKFKEDTLSKYIVPTSMDIPTQGVVLQDNPYQWGPFGAKGMGELVFNGSGAAYIDALSRAIGKNIFTIPQPAESIMHLILNEDKRIKDIKGEC